jgi:hypothetical protein
MQHFAVLHTHSRITEDKHSRQLAMSLNNTPEYLCNRGVVVQLQNGIIDLFFQAGSGVCTDSESTGTGITSSRLKRSEREAKH